MTTLPPMASGLLGFIRDEIKHGRPFPSWKAMVEAAGMEDQPVKAQRFCKDTESDLPTVWHPRFEIAEILQALAKAGKIEAYYVGERKISWRLP